MIEDDKKFLRMLQETFRMEAEEHLASIVACILELEQAQPEARHEIVERLLKTLHTLKGAARAASQSEMEALCHALENVCAVLRATKRVPDAAQFDVLHSAGRVGGELIEGVTGRRRNHANAVIARLNQIGVQLEQDAPALPCAPVNGETVSGPDSETMGAERKDEGHAEPPAVSPQIEVVRVRGERLDVLRRQVEELLPVELGLQHHIDDLQELARRIGGATDGGGPAALEHECRRVAQGLSQVRRQFEMLRTKMMDAVLETALIPLSYALEPLPALVRRLARSRGKEAALDLQGGDILIDRRVLDIARDALVHLVTNAVDHGLELPERRAAAGKPAAGRISIHARQAADGRIAVSVEDDGAGIDVARVAEAASRAGYGQNQPGMNAGEELELVLKTGVSTATEVTHESGRGIGLSIVAEKLAALGGELRIENRPGAGCTFRMRLPVRLSTMRGLVVGVRRARFVLPLAGLESVHTLKEGDLRTVGDRETLMRGTKVLPVLRLGRLLGLGEGTDADDGVALYVQAGDQVFTLLVDEILSEQEILPKTLGRQLRRVPCIGGVAQLGDASLVPILALDDIARIGLNGGYGATAAQTRAKAHGNMKRVLVVEDSITSRLLLKHILEGAGFRVDTAVDGFDALSRLRQDTFDVVVSDIEMPRLDGLTLTERIRENPKTEHLPVILVTSLQSAQERERGLQAGADAYVVKGEFDQDNLLLTIGRLT